MCCSRCGRDCSSCSRREEVGCAGCIEITDGYWGEKCELKECCEGKKLEHCGLCKEFPCALLREFSYDDETGDDGEMLLNCKKWADEKSNDLERCIRRFIIGIVSGGTLGTIVGEWYGSPAPFIIGGIIVGTGIAFMLETNKK